MLTQNHRPQSFAEVKGMSLPLAALKNAAKNPSGSPRNFLFFGGPGVGKTTSARIFPKALNCGKKNGDACNTCSSCLSIMTEGDPRFIEYDVSQVGQVEIIRRLRDSFMFTLAEGYKVVVFDEIQASSSEAQDALLKVLDDSPPDIFFVFCTTNREKISGTMRSRCVELNFGTVDEEQIKEVILSIAEKEEITLEAGVIERIQRRSNGDVRAAIGMLETVRLVGGKQFVSNFCLLDNMLKNYFFEYLKNDWNLDKLRGIVATISKEPVEYIRQDYSRFMRELADLLYPETSEKVEKTDSSIRRLEPVLMDWLEYQQHLGSTNDWYIYLLSLRRFFPRKGG